jgi:hypothetical protein
LLKPGEFVLLGYVGRIACGLGEAETDELGVDEGAIE